MKIIQNTLLFASILTVFSCCAFKPLSKEEEKLAKTRAAQERLNSSQKGISSITTDD